MSEDYGLQLSLSLPPVAQYAKGHMLNIRGETIAEFVENLTAVRELASKDALLAKFFEQAEAEALETVKADLPAKEWERGSTKPLVSPPAASDGKPSRVTDGITKKQEGLIHAIARRKEMDDKSLLALASGVAGGMVSVLSDLTKREASALIDKLNA